MKLLFDSLEGLLTELRDRKVDTVRIGSALSIDTKVRDDRYPVFTRHIVVTAALDDHSWAEYRCWTGSRFAAIDEHGFKVPEQLVKVGDRVLAEISQQVDDAGFSIREGMLAADSHVIDSLRR